MGLFDQFPYTNFHELNLDWILKALKELEHTIEQFVAINALKYADPIQWNIVSQYEKNTIVIDPQSGTAYISVQPVPSGVALTNEDYWTVVFDLGQFVVRASKNFANTYEAETTLTATVSTAAGGWLVWGDTLYKALVNITAGDSYVVSGNIAHFTMEDIIGHLQDLTTTDKSNLVAAINEVVTNLATETQDRQTADTTLQGNIDAEALARENADQDLRDYIDGQIESIKSPIYYNVQDYGAKGDGVTDDTQAFIDAIAAANLTNGMVFVPDVANFYLITSTLVLGSKSFIMGEKEAEIHFTSTNLFSISNYYGSIENLVIKGNNTNNAIFFDLDTAVVYIWRFNHLHIMNCVHAFYDAVTGNKYIVDCIFNDINCDYTYGTQFLSNRSRGFITLRNFKADNTNNLRDISWDSIVIRDVIGLELESVDVVGPVTRGDYTVSAYQNVWGIKIIGVTDGKASIWLSRVLVDTAPINGISIQNVDFINGNYVEAFGIAGNGILIANSRYINLSNVYTRGLKGASYAATGANGLTLDTCEKANICNVITQLNTGSGLSLVHTTDCNICNVHSENNTNYGYYEFTDGDRNIITNGSFTSNGVGQVVQSGAESCLIGSVISGSTLISQKGSYTA